MAFCKHELFGLELKAIVRPLLSSFFFPHNPSYTPTLSKQVSGNESYFVSVFDGFFQGPGTYPSL